MGRMPLAYATLARNCTPLTSLAFNLNRTPLTTTPAVHTHIQAVDESLSKQQKAFFLRHPSCNASRLATPIFTVPGMQWRMRTSSKHY